MTVTAPLAAKPMPEMVSLEPTLPGAAAVVWGLIELLAVTVNFLPAVLVPSVAITLWSPTSAVVGTLKLVVKAPLALLWTVTMVLLSKVISTPVLPRKPLPWTSTVVPVLPLLGLMLITATAVAKLAVPVLPEPSRATTW